MISLFFEILPSETKAIPKSLRIIDEFDFHLSNYSYFVKLWHEICFIYKDIRI